MEKLRVVPKERNFYAANPPHEEHMATLQATLRKYINLPTVPREEAMVINWSNYAQYKIIGGGTRLKPLQYKSLIKVLNRLSLIDPQLMPDEVVETIRPFMRDTQSVNSVQKVKSLDKFGRAINVGRRKNSSATVQVVRATDSIMGQIIVNGKTLDEFFPKLSDRQTIVYPLKVVNSITNFNIFATVQGGGSTGQAGAVAEGITKTLIMFNPLFKRRLRKAGCATHDSRVVERKKPGRKKARKMPTWVKR
ncbi:hypothetical protein NADFUDRAFT_20439 [Nadsonia fulvescens var. elongata DSM 6958]|uniref:Small ribosomal subunit protein uS9m n=1 Tax=Nadsonia fulvescens var. elongata DSM 6958 TaxID=857566 RepID=A0A1E3PR14_9ASCO|nr:hypothetical protein NADFUDRAFT_20439 [Nadsonia fulvescens var. elongata DSM 6958]